MNEVKLNPRWVVAARLTLSLVKKSSAYFHADIMQASARDVMLCAGVYIGQAEGRPMTASKLADFIGMPRPTVIRRLAELKMLGKVTQNRAGKWLMLATKGEAIAIVERMFRENIADIHRAAAALSKLDNVNIANQK